MTELAEAVRKGIDRTFIDWAKEFGEKQKVTTSQIRKIYVVVKKMQQSSLDQERLLLLRAQMAYAAKRDRGLGDLQKQLNDAVNAVVETNDNAEAENRFNRFCQGFEAILAYHQAGDGQLERRGI